MNVFVSWSRPLSRAIAKILQPWVEKVHPRINPISSFDVPPGSNWFAEILQKLAEGQAGILIVTPENVDSPWLLFEAGAMAARTSSSSRVIPLLFGLTTREFEDVTPLSEFQAIEFSRDGLLEVIKSINNMLETKSIPPSTLGLSFDTHWEDLSLQVATVLQEHATEQPEQPTGSPSRSKPHLLARYRRLFDVKPPSLIAGVYDGTSATQADQLGFDALWLSSLCLSSALGIPDNETMPIDSICRVAATVHAVTDIPLIVDAETGLSPRAPFAATLQDYASSGVTGVCFEDAAFPKVNVLQEVSHQVRPIGAFVNHLQEILALAHPLELGVIARTNALAAGESKSQVLERIEAYFDVGVDGIIVHDNAGDPTRVLELLRTAGSSVPLGVIPTTFPHVTYEELSDHGARFIIYANQSCRGAIFAIKKIYRQIKESGCTGELEEELEPVSILTTLFG